MTSSATAAAPEKAAVPQRRAMPLGRWMTIVLLLWISLDVLLRFGSLNWLNTLPQLQAARLSGGNYPFQPGYSGIHDPWVGETALTANLVPEESRPPVRFSTDSIGYRLTPGMPPGSRADALVFGGRSMAYGGSLSDDETLSAVLTRMHSVRTYNAGRFFWDLELLAGLDYVLQNLAGSKPTVIELYWEDFDPSRNDLERARWRTDGPGSAALGSERYFALRRTVQDTRRSLAAWWTVSPAEIISTRLIKRISNGTILPNPYLAGVEARRLPNGQRILFLAEEVERVHRQPSQALLLRNADYYSYFRNRLKDRGLDLQMVLVPNRYSVYGPLTDGVAANPPEPYLNRLETELTSRGIRTLNLLDLYRRNAPEEVRTGDLSFYREDHHWAPAGVRRAATAIAAALAGNRGR